MEPKFKIGDIVRIKSLIDTSLNFGVTDSMLKIGQTFKFRIFYMVKLKRF